MAKKLAPPKRHHIDKHAEHILKDGATGADDELLTEREMADWWRVSPEWFQQGRLRGYGPQFVTLGPNCIRYTRGAGRTFLRERSFTSTAEARRNRKSA
jgi:hypothetical protein